MDINQGVTGRAFREMLSEHTELTGARITERKN